MAVNDYIAKNKRIFERDYENWQIIKLKSKKITCKFKNNELFSVERFDFQN